MVVLGLLAAWLVRDTATPVATRGRPAPQFVVSIIGGGEFDLADHVGGEGPIVVNQWASWCLPCREEIPAISAFADAHPEVSVVGVAVEDSESAATAFAEEIGASYHLAIGDTAFEEAYPRLGLPVTYVIDDSGTVVEVFNGIVDEETLAELTSG